MDEQDWEIPEDHPRALSLEVREKIILGMDSGIVAKAGLIAHGRGEAFDYLLGETTPACARASIRATAASFLLAKDPVVSVNGNVAVLVSRELVSLAGTTGAKLEVNLFYRTESRVNKIVDLLEDHGARNVFGRSPDTVIPGLGHARGKCTEDGIYGADFVLVPLEDGDRTKALVDMGKTVATVDLNPLSRSARDASITIVDNITRCLGEIEKEYKALDRTEAAAVLEEYDNDAGLSGCLDFMAERLRALSHG